jgi:C_GCAxxG_C_C family probable redox protein
VTTTTLSEGQQDRLAQRVKETLSASGNCAQTAFAVLQDEFRLDGGEILKALTPFPGIALRGETCGAITGCLMALGLVYGRDELTDWKGYIASLPPTRRFCRRFVEQYGSTACVDILEEKLGRTFDLADRAEALEYATSGGLEACAEIVADAVQIAAGLMSKASSQRAAPVS